MNNNLIVENGILKAIDIESSTITIPAEIIRIGKGVFRGSKVTSVKFEGEKLRSIDDDAFRDCTRLKNIMIPEGVIQIGDNAFYGCLSLEYIGIPESVVLVGDNILGNCNRNLIIIGKDQSEAASVASKYNLPLIGDYIHAISTFDKATAEKSCIETKTFDIFGESVTCSNTLSKYHSNLEYYSSRKDPVFQEVFNRLPKTISDSFGDLLPIFQN